MTADPSPTGQTLPMVSRLLVVLLVVWFAVGALAAWQRDYFKGDSASCAKAGTIAATVAAGPLDYAGVNPKVHCALPKPSS